jgi:transcriptional regulator with XRE-family HTH domain
MQEQMEELEQKVEAVLLPHQLERLDEIQLQLRGADALTDENVAEKLGLSDDQVSQLESIRDETAAQMRELFQAGGFAPGADVSDEDRQARREQFQQLREEASEKLLAVLTEEQQQQFDEMKGEPFELDMSQFRGQGGRRGPGGGGRPRGGQQDNDT